jgi:O-antigen biosynthesis protein
MAERAHPDEPGFQEAWRLRRFLGVIPYWGRKNPYREAFMWRYAWVSRHSLGKDVVDIPCGMGWGTSLIRGARSLTGLDISAEAIVEARERYGEHADFEVGDMSHVGVGDRCCDVLSCLEGIEHVPVEVGEKFLAEAHRILRPNGLMLLSSPYCRMKAHSGNPYHIHEYRPDEIRSKVSKYFHIERVETRDVDDLTVLYLTCRKKDL